MKLSKVRNSDRISKVLIAILISTIFVNLSFAQYPTVIPQNYPATAYPQGYPTNIPQTQRGQGTTTQPTTTAGRTVNITEEETEMMTHEDSVRVALEERENEDLELETLRRKIFGYKLFNGQTFDPNSVLNIPTPGNYVLGANDKLIIDIYGYSQSKEEVVVNADGFITVPKAGVIKVGGLTIEEAEPKIRASLAKLYYGLQNGSTNMKISLNDVRTIKITITGEVIAPGTYTMSSLNTVLNALYRAGGPNELGSFREVNLIRNNKVEAKIDLYDILIKGYSESNRLLKDQDIIQVPTYKERVIIEGEAKRNGYFELLPSEKLNDALTYAGGFAPNAYKHRIKVYRNNSKEKEIIDVANSKFDSFEMQSGDSLVINPVLERFTNLVTVEGAVYRPGEYSLNNNPTLTSLITSAEGLMTDALVGRVSLVRTNEDLTTSNISVNFRDILNGSAPDIDLQREDLIIIPSKFDLTEVSTIRISGAINNEDAEEGVELPYVKNMTLEDILTRVGGLTEAASLTRVEIVRRKRNVDVTKANAQISEVIVLDVNPDLEVVSGRPNVVLEPYDQIFVRKSPNYEEQTFVEIQGEVYYPAVYGIANKEERISDLIKRAGGVTLQGYIPGATLIRTVQLSQIELEQRRKAFENLATTTDDNQIIEVEEVDETIEETIGINLQKILKNPGSDEDLMLRDGDIIQIPKLLETVRVQGEVLYPTTVKFMGGSSFKSYITGAGGFTKASFRRKTYVRYPNGSIDRTKKFLVFNLYPKIQPGSEIIVPQKAQNGTEQLTAFGNILGTLSATLGTIFTIYSLVKLNTPSSGN